MCFFSSNYEIKKNERLVGMFDEFNSHLTEEALWQISEEIKPRGGKKKAESETGWNIQVYKFIGQNNVIQYFLPVLAQS